MASLHSSLFTSHFSLFTFHFSLFTPHFSLFTLLPSPFGEGLGVRLGVGGEALFSSPRGGWEGA